MKITKIEKQKQKQTGRYNLYLDGRFWLGIGENVLVQLGLYKNQEVSQDLLNKVSYHEEINKYYLKAITYLSYGLRSVKEVETYLAKEIPQDQVHRQENIDTIIEKLKSQSYLNDLIYGQAYVRTKMNINRKGPDLIRQELLTKGLSEDLINQALEEYPYNLGQENINHLARKFLNRQKQVSRRMALDKLYNYLRTKGYSGKWLEDFDFDQLLADQDRDEEAILDKEANKLLRTKSRKYSGRDLKVRLIQSLMRKGFAYSAIQAWLDKQAGYFIE